MDDTAGDSSPSSEHPPPPSSSQQPILLPSTTQPRLPTVAEEEDSSLIGQPLPPSEQPPPLLSERSPAPPSEQPPPPTSNEPPALIVPPDHVNLRVVYLVTGNPRPPHSLGVLPVNTTVSALREQIQSELPEHPSPQRQRLIYHGRPLLRGDATLREVFRIQVSMGLSRDVLGTNGEYIGWKYPRPSPIYATYCHPASARWDHHRRCTQPGRTLESAPQPGNGAHADC